MIGLEQALAEIVRLAVSDLRDEIAMLRAEVKELHTRLGPGAEGANPRFLSPDDAAVVAGGDPETVREWTRRGDLPVYHAGRLLRIQKSDLVAYLARKTDPSNEVEDLARVRELLQSVRNSP